MAYLLLISDSIHVPLTASKTRIYPVKYFTLPRLELAGAFLLVELVTAIVKFKVDEILLWCDFLITLCWITNPLTKYNQILKHRVEKINLLTAIGFKAHSGKI